MFTLLDLSKLCRGFWSISKEHNRCIRKLCQICNQKIENLKLLNNISKRFRGPCKLFSIFETLLVKRIFGRKILNSCIHFIIHTLIQFNNLHFVPSGWRLLCLRRTGRFVTHPDPCAWRAITLMWPWHSGRKIIATPVYHPAELRPLGPQRNIP